jgi:hypothetical protein
MANEDGMNERWRKFLLPGAVSLVGAGAGLALSRTEKLRDSLPSLGEIGIGDLADDLRSKLSSTVGTDSNAGGRRTIDSAELEDHRNQRAERRRQRAGR